MSLRPTPLYRGVVGAVAICVSAVAAGSGAYASSPAAGPKPGSHWQVFPAGSSISSSSLAIDGPGRVLYTFSQDKNHTLPAGIQAWSLDRGTQLTPKVVLPGAVVGSAMPLAVDSADHAVFVADIGAVGGAPTVVVAKREGGTIATRTVTSRFPAAYSIVGMTVDARHRVLYLLGEPTACVATTASTTGSICPGAAGGAGTNQVKVDSWSLAALSGGTVSSPYSAPLTVPGCGEIITSNFPAGAIVSANGNHLYFGCTSNAGLVTLLGPTVGVDIGGVADLDLTVAKANGSNSLQLRPVSGNFSGGDSIAVPSEGRLILVSPGAGTTNFKVYDTVHGYYVGAVGVDNNQVFGVGIDPANGMGYYIDRRGITSVDFSGLPVPQGNLDSTFAIDGPVTDRTVAVDPASHRVFMAGSEDLTSGTAPFAEIYRGVIPPGSADPFAISPFAGIDSPEIPGVTDSQRVVTMGALGAEERLVGGTYDVSVNVTHVDPRCEAVRCGTRTIDMGVLNGIQLSNDQAAAQAVTQYQDAHTTDDETAQTPSSYPSEVPPQVPTVPKEYQFSGGYTPADPVGCTDFASSPTTVPAAPDPAHESEKVHCDLAGQNVSASATAKPGRILINAPCVPTPGKDCTPADAGKTVPDPVSIKSATATVDVSRTGAGPLVTTITSEADGINIMDLIQIGKVTATATITAHGRSGSAKVKYTPVVNGLVIAGKTVCDSDCPPATVVSAINTALGDRGRFTMWSPTIVQAANGRLALIQDNGYHHAEQVVLDDLSDDDVLTPAMSFTLNLDGSTNSREIVRLAALGGQEIYRVFALTSFVPSGGPGQQGNLVNVGGRLAGPGSVVANTPFVAPPASPQPQAASSGGIGGILSRAMHLGLRSPGDIAGVAILWMLLAVPAYLAARRRLLLDLPRLTPKGNS